MRRKAFGTVAGYVLLVSVIGLPHRVLGATCTLDMDHAPWPGIIAVCDYNGGVNVGPALNHPSCEITNYKFESRCCGSSTWNVVQDGATGSYHDPQTSPCLGGYQYRVTITCDCACTGTCVSAASGCITACPPLGRCCLPDQTCQETSQATCTGLNGTWTAGAHCYTGNECLM